MSSPMNIFPAWTIIAGAVAGVLCYAVAATLRPQSSGTEQRLDQMQAEIDTLRARLDTVDALATDAATTAADLQFDQEREPGE
jgi:hypothetical protein